MIKVIAFDLVGVLVNERDIVLSNEEEKLENIIKEKYKLDSFVKIDNNDVDIVIIKKEHDISLANKIMKTTSGEFEDKVSVSIKFA